MIKKIQKTLPLVVLSIASLVTSASAQSSKAKLLEIGKKFEQLPEGARIEYVKHKKKAFVSSRKNKHFTAMVEIDDALHIFPDDMDLIYLDGICRAQIHDVDGAIERYKNVMEISPTHVPTLMNLVEINFFAKRYKAAVGYIDKMNKLMDNLADKRRLPLLEFKYLISLTKLAKGDSAKYAERMARVRDQYTHMDDQPFYYYAQALKAFDEGDKQEGLIWIMKAYLIFRNPKVIEIWNKALVDSGYIGAHEIMFKQRKK